MEFSVKVEGLDRLARKSEAFAKIAEQEIARALFASAKKVEGDAKRSVLSGQKSGRIYKRKTVVHRASAPGEAPASDTGRLVNSINSYLATSSMTAFVVAGRGTAGYAALLENGTRNIAPRPFMFPALELNRAWIKDRIDQAVNKAIERSSKA
jgi:hypothetical protein